MCQFSVVENLLSGQFAGAACDAAARMSSRSALIVSCDWSAVLVPTCGGPIQKQLLRKHLSSKNVAFAQSNNSLDVQWRDDFAMDDQVAEPGEEFFERFLDRVA